MSLLGARAAIARGGAHAAAPDEMQQRLPKAEFDWIFSRVPRLTVEVVISTPERGVLLALRDVDPCRGMWHLHGGTVRFGEPLVEAVKRVAQDELGVTVTVGPLLGYIEYPSHYNNGPDSPVGLAFAAAMSRVDELPPGCRWFRHLPANMHDEQRRFLVAHRPGRTTDDPVRGSQKAERGR